MTRVRILSPIGPMTDFSQHPERKITNYEKRKNKGSQHQITVKQQIASILAAIENDVGDRTRPLQQGQRQSRERHKQRHQKLHSATLLRNKANKNWQHTQVDSAMQRL